MGNFGWGPVSEANGPVDNKITEPTRRHLMDAYQLQSIKWAGELGEAEFLAHIFNMRALPSTDNRYKDAYQDVHQHRIRNDDWDASYVFTDRRFNLLWGDDETFIKFLEMTVHPLARGGAEAAGLVELYNTVLHRDGYQMMAEGENNGRFFYKVKPRTSFHGDVPQVIAAQPILTDAGVLHEHLQRIKDGLAKDPASAISSSKELLESLFKLILKQQGVEIPGKDDIPSLYKKVGESLKVNAESVPGSSEASQTMQKILRTLTTTVLCIAELRNEIGTGHGRASESLATEAHARLALNSTVTIAEFLLDTLQQRMIA
ncbi:abortive infection family protein [Arthrobacter sp. A2-55]|uniref:abortive infection family protein n=1 Tax=Arthrobacter sp. A2-55 TaxID=2897337 RepID=UPI0021CDCB45|nr:abortive infection family protein [Arthrobacter sp. A2-55]